MLSWCSNLLCKKRKKTLEQELSELSQISTPVYIETSFGGTDIVKLDPLTVTLEKESVKTIDVNSNVLWIPIDKDGDIVQYIYVTQLPSNVFLFSNTREICSITRDNIVQISDHRFRLDLFGSNNALQLNIEILKEPLILCLRFNIVEIKLIDVIFQYQNIDLLKDPLAMMDNYIMNMPHGELHFKNGLLRWIPSK